MREGKKRLKKSPDKEALKASGIEILTPKEESRNLHLKTPIKKAQKKTKNPRKR